MDHSETATNPHTDLIEDLTNEEVLEWLTKEYAKGFWTPQFPKNNAAYGFINDLVANSPINWMFDYYS